MEAVRKEFIDKQVLFRTLEEGKNSTYAGGKKEYPSENLLVRKVAMQVYLELVKKALKYDYLHKVDDTIGDGYLSYIFYYSKVKSLLEEIKKSIKKLIKELPEDVDLPYLLVTVDFLIKNESKKYVSNIMMTIGTAAAILYVAKPLFSPLKKILSSFFKPDVSAKGYDGSVTQYSLLDELLSQAKECLGDSTYLAIATISLSHISNLFFAIRLRKQGMVDNVKSTPIDSDFISQLDEASKSNTPQL